MTDFESPRVDGLINDWVRQPTIDDVIRLDRLGLSAADIASRLNVSVLEVEHSLSRLVMLKAFSSRMER
jgi:DNA-binding NarL/FixJ family response regulator